MLEKGLLHIKETAKVPSFSSYEERIHPYIRKIFSGIRQAEEIASRGNNLIFRCAADTDQPTIALAAHLDKINHYGEDFPEELPVQITSDFIEGAMDDCAGLGIILCIAEQMSRDSAPNLLYFFSEMEESTGLKEHPERLKNDGIGYQAGMGAQRIVEDCKKRYIIPDEVITLDTTPLFKGKPGIAVYSKHWEYNRLNPSAELVSKTEIVVRKLREIDSSIKLDNNTNDYLQYGQYFNEDGSDPVVSIAVEPAIYPYHKKAERVYIEDIRQALDLVYTYLTAKSAEKGFK